MLFAVLATSIILSTCAAGPLRWQCPLDSLLHVSCACRRIGVDFLPLFVNLSDKFADGMLTLSDPSRTARS